MFSYSVMCSLLFYSFVSRATERNLPPVEKGRKGGLYPLCCMLCISDKLQCVCVGTL